MSHDDGHCPGCRKRNYHGETVYCEDCRAEIDRRLAAQDCSEDVEQAPPSVPRESTKRLCSFYGGDDRIVQVLRDAGYSYVEGPWHIDISGTLLPGPSYPGDKTYMRPQLELAPAEAAALDLILRGHSLLYGPQVRLSYAVYGDYGSRRFG